MITVETYENYFKTEILDKYAKIKRIINIDLFDFDTFLNELKSYKTADYPILVLENYQVKTIANHQHNIHNALSCGLSVLNFFDVRKKDVLTKSAFLTEMEHIILQIRKKMLDDSERNCMFLSGLIPDSIGIGKTETLAGGYLGYRMSFFIEDTDTTELDNDWNG